MTRSIPNLRRPNASGPLSAISRDRDGFYRPSPSSDSSRQASQTHFLNVPIDTTHQLFSPPPSIPRRPHNAVSLSNLRPHKEGDVFGRLLGWSYSPHTSDSSPLPLQSDSTSAASRSEPMMLKLTDESLSDLQSIAAGDISLDNPSQSLTSHQDQQYATRISDSPAITDWPPQATASERPNSGLEGTAILSHAIVCPLPQASTLPFGQGVRLPSLSKLRRRKSFGGTVPPQHILQTSLIAPDLILPENGCESTAADRDIDLAIGQANEDIPRALREAASNETIRTSPYLGNRDSDPALVPFTSEATRKQEQPSSPMSVTEEERHDSLAMDTRIFDTLQMLDNGERKRSSRNLSLTARTSLTADQAFAKRHEVSLACYPFRLPVSPLISIGSVVRAAHP